MFAAEVGDFFSQWGLVTLVYRDRASWHWPHSDREHRCDIIHVHGDFCLLIRGASSTSQPKKLPCAFSRKE